MNKTGILVILGTGIIVVLIFIFSNFNIQVNINSKGDVVKGSQTDSMHGKSVPADSTIFNSLVGKSSADFTLETYDGNEIALSSL